jgi:hypothetical protein
VLSPITPALFLEPIPYEGEVARTDAPSWRETRARGRLSLAVHIGGQSVVRTAGEGCANTASPLHEQRWTDATAAAFRLGLRQPALARAPREQDRSAGERRAGLYRILPDGRALRDGMSPGRSRRPNREPIARPRSFPFPGGIGSDLLPAAGRDTSSHPDLRALARHFGAGPFIPRALRLFGVERHGSNSQATDQRDRQIPDLSHVPVLPSLVGFNEANHVGKDQRRVPDLTGALRKNNGGFHVLGYC